jgi:hypothetical protein
LITFSIQIEKNLNNLESEEKSFNYNVNLFLFENFWHTLQWIKNTPTIGKTSSISATKKFIMTLSNNYAHISDALNIKNIYIVLKYGKSLI